jgi:hypothetical protein
VAGLLKLVVRLRLVDNDVDATGINNTVENIGNIMTAGVNVHGWNLAVIVMKTM